MTVTSIWTPRRLQHQVFRQIVEEWEDDFAKELDLPLKDSSRWAARNTTRLGWVVRRIPGLALVWDDAWRFRRRKPNDCCLAFLLWPPSLPSSYQVQGDVIPIVIDFWPEHLRTAEQVFSRVPLMFVTNVELKEYLDGTSLAAKTHYIPLSVSARHILNETPVKTFDLIQVGRRNDVLHNWALRYAAERPSTDYLYVGNRHGYTPQWVSVKRGPLNLDNSRSTYMQLLQSARVSLVSSPGIDGGEKRTGGFNPVTPRFYESAAARCHLVGRFPLHGKDVIENRVSSVCRHVESFNDFVARVDEVLVSTPDLKLQDDFLTGHTSGDVARLVGRVLRENDILPPRSER